MGTLGSRSLIFPDGQGEKDIGRQVRGGSPLGSWGPEVLFSSTGRGERASDGEVRGKNPRRSWVPESAFSLTGRGKRQSRAFPESLEILPAPLSSRAQILVERPGTAWGGLARPGTAWHGLARPGTAWGGLARPGTIFVPSPAPQATRFARRSFLFLTHASPEGRRI